MGKGEALKTGFNYVLKNMSKVKYVVVIDADMQYSPEEAVRILKPLQEEKVDFVVGYRNWRIVPFFNKFGNFIWRILFNFFFNTNFKDTNCGFIGLKKNAIEKIKKIYGGYIIENAILRDVVKNDLKFKQVPVNVKYRKTNVSHFARMFFGILIFIITEGMKYRLSKI
jgi:glycosyltransferase involved in cell wall biosynthesis